MSLAVFVLVLLVDVAALGLDALLYLTDRPTITQRVRARPLWAAAIVGWQLAGVLALVAHFLGA